ncbi:MAG: hypothetical protein GX616_14350 [Planctomycetes bacterium]|nr:hypothetical protein [Planctomycetota bacterium]
MKRDAMRPRGVIGGQPQGLPLLSGLLVGSVLLLAGQVAAEPTAWAAAKAITQDRPYAPAACVEVIQNGGFESGGGVGWQEYSLQGYELVNQYNPWTGVWGAFLGGVNEADDRLSQAVTLPAGASLTLTAWWSLATDEQPYERYDTLTLSLHRPDGSLLVTLATLDNTAEENTWERLTFDLTSYAGQNVTIRFAALTDLSDASDFYLDDVTLLACDSDVTPTPTATGAVATSTPTVTSTVATSTPSATRDPALRVIYLPLILK